MEIIDANNCEFGYELIMVVPYVYFLHQNGTTVGVKTFLDMKPFYFFLNDNCFLPNHTKKRDHGMPINTELKSIHFSQLTSKKWKVPNYLKHYKNKVTELDRKVCISYKKKYDDFCDFSVICFVFF